MILLVCLNNSIPKFSGGNNMKSKFKMGNLLITVLLVFGLVNIQISIVRADAVAQTLPFSQNWSNSLMIVANDDWSGVPGIMGYLGDYTTSSPANVDPQTLLADYAVTVDVIADQSDPNTLTAGGVAEFDGPAITNRVVALQGSGTADAPFLLINLDTTGNQDIFVSYLVRDIDGSADNAAQQVALHYRVGNTGDFTNVPLAYIADATEGGTATKVTQISVTLPANANNQSLVQLRIMTTNATGSDEWVGIDDISVTGTPLAGDQAPTVLSTVPTDDAINVAIDANITITFSEPVTVVPGWFDITCDVSGTHTAVVDETNDPIFMLDPDTNFATSDTCTVTIDAASVTDDDEDDTVSDAMLEDYIFSFKTIAACSDPFTAIYTIQGDAAASTYVGQTVTTEGVVVGDFQVGGKNGFFIQDEIGDADTTTSDGIFIYYSSAPDVNVGDKVRLIGSVSEYFGLTQITGSAMQICSTENTIEPLELTLPFEDTDHEDLEGMLVTFPQALVISEYFNFDRYGELLLTSERHSTPTAIVEPGQDAIDMAAYHELDSIAVDDGSSYQNPSILRHPDGSAFGLDYFFRGGDTIEGLTGVMDYNFDVWKIQPVGTAIYEAVNLRAEAPELVPGEIRIASLNVLNYFTTLDAGTSAWICGPSGTMECRGADANQPQELARQQAKIVNAILGMDADIVGLMEIENEHTGQLDDEPVISLVNLLNAATEPGMYSYIATGPIGTDAIKQAILYKTEKVEVVGDFAVLDSSVDARFDTTRNRPSLAQTFMDKVTQEIFTVSVNHLKSKGSACADDPDLGDGAGNCNLTRKAAAEALVEWLETDPTETGSDMYVIIGDLNSYAMEDPIDMIKLGADDLPDTADDYFNLVDRFREPAAYGYVYDGQTGYLDHALGNRKFASYVLDANFWHINADESDVFDYDTSFKPDLVDAMFDPTTPYRSSDHDPVLISVLLNHPPVATDDTFTTPVGSVLIVGAPGVLANDTDVNIYDKITVTLVVDSGPLHGELVLNEDGSFTYTPDPGFVGEDTFEYIMHATPGLMDNYSDTATVTITVTALQLFLPLILR